MSLHPVFPGVFLALMTVVPFLRRGGLCLPPPIFSSDMVLVRHSACRIADLGPSALLAGHGPPHIDNTPTAIRAFVSRLNNAAGKTAAALEKVVGSSNFSGKESRTSIC